MILRWDDSYLVDDDDSSLGTTVISGMTVIRDRAQRQRARAPAPHLRHYWLRSWCQASLYWLYLDCSRCGESVMWIWLFRADVGIMYQVSVSIT